MFGLTAKLLNSKQVIDKMASMAKRSDKEMVEALGNSVLLVHETAVKSIQAHESKGYKYGDHYASMPWNPPNTDTARLVQSIRWAINSKNLYAVVGTSLDYGAFLEFGTRGRIEPRPWLMPAFLKNLREIRLIHRAAFLKVVYE